jgi:hypothetical protein
MNHGLGRTRIRRERTSRTAAPFRRAPMVERQQRQQQISSEACARNSS